MNFADRSLATTYDIQGEIARGGMGKIHRATDKKLQRELAMKIILDTGDPEKYQKLLDHFIGEARITAQLEHPNIIPVHEIGLLDDGKIYFTMKLVAGEPLFHIIKMLKKDSEAYLQQYTMHQLLVIFRKVCDAIAFAHSRNIIHRDIKPDNIMVGHYGEVLLMDWGIAKMMDAIPPKSAETRLIRLPKPEEREGKIFGTPYYLSPEQAAGHTKMVDKLSDVYLLGATLYHMTTLNPPHVGKDVADLLACATSGSFPPPQERNPARQISQELSRIIMKAMALKKENRYPSVEALASDIDNLMSGHIVSRPITFKPGEFMIRQGETGKEAYTILRGGVEVFQNIADKNILLATMGPGDIVGEMGLISAAKRSADVVAKEETEVLVIDEKLLKQVLDRMPPWMEKITSTLVKRLQVANDKVHPLKVGDPVYHILNQLGMTCSLMAFRSGMINVEDYQVPWPTIMQEISVSLALDAGRVENIFNNLLATELCAWKDESRSHFHFHNFTLFCHVLDFLRSVLEVERPLDWMGELPALDAETHIKRCKIASQLSKEVKEFLRNIPKYAKLIE